MCFQGPCSFRDPRSQLLFDDSGTQFVFHVPGPQFVFTGSGPQFVFACFTVKFVIVTVLTYINSASTYIYILLKYNLKYNIML